MLQIKIDARVDDDRHAAAPAAARAARMRATASSMVRTGSRAWRAVLQIDADRAGADDLGDALRDRVGRLAIAGFDVGCKRHAYRSDDPLGRRDHVRPRRLLAVAIAERPGNAAAGGRDGRKPAASKIRALIGSQALGSSRSGGARCSLRKSSANFRCSDVFTAPPCWQLYRCADACYAISAHPAGYASCEWARKGRDRYDARSFEDARSVPRFWVCCCLHWRGPRLPKVRNSRSIRSGRSRCRTTGLSARSAASRSTRRTISGSSSGRAR